MTKLLHNYQLSVALFLLLCAASLDFLVLNVRADSEPSPSLNSAIPAKTNPQSSPESVSQRVREALEKIRPSLVTINASSQGQSQSVAPPLLPEFSYGDFNSFNDLTPFPQIFRTDFELYGFATGVVVSEDGFVWTTNDIVQGLDSVTVTLQDQTSYDGKVILSDAESGLGIVKINAKTVPAVQLATTAKLKPADWAIAVALDDRREPNLAAGMISNFKRPESDSEIGTIRCSFPVDADFAGCAVVNLDGELIGINAGMRLKRGVTSTASYALDSGSAKELHQKAIQNTSVSREDAIRKSEACRVAGAPGKSTQTGKEGKVRQIEMMSRLFAVPSPEWTSGSITSSIRNWLGSWQDADVPLPHPVSNASESR